MSRHEGKLNVMGFALPKAWQYPSANRAAVVQLSQILYVSGGGPACRTFPVCARRARSASTLR